MDSTNGHSEENQPKKRVEVSFDKEKLKRPLPEMRELDLSALPFKMQEEIRVMMDAMGMVEAPKVFEITVPMETSIVPIDLLANEFKDAILEDRFEDAENIAKEIKSRNYTIDITEKMISLTYNKD